MSNASNKCQQNAGQYGSPAIYIEEIGASVKKTQILESKF